MKRNQGGPRCSLNHLPGLVLYKKTSTSRQVKSDVNVPEEKVSIPRKNLVEGVPIFILCYQDGLTPSTIYTWKRDPQKYPLPAKINPN
jgi:hypothetical protein